MGQFSSTFKKIANILRYRILYPKYRSGKSLPTNKESIPPFKKSTAYLNIRLAIKAQKILLPCTLDLSILVSFICRSLVSTCHANSRYVSYEVYGFQLDTCKSTLSVTCWTAASESPDLLLPLGRSIWALKIK